MLVMAAFGTHPSRLQTVREGGGGGGKGEVKSHYLSCFVNQLSEIGT